jgi:NitT/TauT family transport system substrate-binding protein
MAALGDSRWSRREWLKAALVGAAGTTLACARGGSAPPVASPAPAAPAPPSASGAAPAPAASSGTRVPRVNASMKVGYLRNIGSGPVYLAIERGYFKEVGVNVESVLFQSGAEMVASLGTGELGVGNGALSPGLYNAWGRDIRILVAADGGTLRPGYGSSWMMVRAGLADQVRDWSDLRGRKVSASVEGSVIDYMVRSALRQHNMSLDDVDLVRLASPDMLSAFQGGALDAGGAAEAFATQIADLGLAVKWKNGAEVNLGEEYSGLLVSEQVARDRDLGVAVVYAYLRGVRDYMAGQKTDPAVLAILQQYSGVDQALIQRATPTFVDVNGEVQPDRMRAQQEFWVREGVMQRVVDPTPFVNQEFAAAAVDLLGRATNPPAPTV